MKDFNKLKSQFEARKKLFREERAEKKAQQKKVIDHANRKKPLS